MNLVGLASKALGVEPRGSLVLRRRRFQGCLDLIDATLAQRDLCRLIDIGGEPAYWDDVADLIGSRRLHVTLVNHEAFAVDETRFTSIGGDARDLGSFADMSFDVVHSNSVIEHVGNWQDMTAMAGEVRRLAPRYFVQTPNFWFPIEPHCATFFFHWVPVPVRVSMLLRRPRGNWGRAPDPATAMQWIQSNSLLDRRMLATLFPDATIRTERFFGLNKSLIAVRSAVE